MDPDQLQPDPKPCSQLAGSKELSSFVSDPVPSFVDLYLKLDPTLKKNPDPDAKSKFLFFYCGFKLKQDADTDPDKKKFKFTL